MKLPEFAGRARYVAIGVFCIFVAILGALAVVEVLQVERGQEVQIGEHRQFNQRDHDSICAYLRDAARTAGRPLYPCGSESHPHDG